MLRLTWVCVRKARPHTCLERLVLRVDSKCVREESRALTRGFVLISSVWSEIPGIHYGRIEAKKRIMHETIIRSQTVRRVGALYDAKALMRTPFGATA